MKGYLFWPGDTFFFSLFLSSHTRCKWGGGVRGGGDNRRWEIGSRTKTEDSAEFPRVGVTLPSGGHQLTLQIWQEMCKKVFLWRRVQPQCCFHLCIVSTFNNLVLMITIIRYLCAVLQQCHVGLQVFCITLHLVISIVCKCFNDERCN